MTAGGLHRPPPVRGLLLWASLAAAAIAAAGCDRPGRAGDNPGTVIAPTPAEVVAALDRGIDSVLRSFGAAESSVRKRTLAAAGSGFARTERTVPPLDSVPPVTLNAALAAMAREHGATAAASENLKLRTVTVHIAVGGTVVHTVIVQEKRRAPPRTR